MNNIDQMVEDLINHLNRPGVSSQDLLVSAINVASIQLDYANHEVGESIKKLKRMAVDSAVRSEVEAEISARKMYAALLGRGLDRIVAMYTKANG